MVLVFLLLPLQLNAQEDTIVYSKAFRPDSAGNNLKSAKDIQAWSYMDCWNGSYYSDYWNYFRWYDQYYQCDCPNGWYNVKITLNGWDVRWPDDQYGTTYTGTNCKVAIGPSQSGNYRDVCYEGGNDGYFLFGCTYGCGAYWYATSDKGYWTAGIRPPTSPVASQAQWDYRIDLSLETRPPIFRTPNTDTGFYGMG